MGVWVGNNSFLTEEFKGRRKGFPDGSAVKNPPAILERPEFDPWIGRIPWRKKWQPTPGFLPEKSHRQRSLAGDSPRGRKESDMTD